MLEVKSIESANTQPKLLEKKNVIYDLIIQQIYNLIRDLRVVFPRDIVLKVLQDNIPCLVKNKVSALTYLSQVISPEIKELLLKRDESLFDADNKSLKNIKFKRSEFVFNKLRKNWKELDHNNKLIVWKYLNFINKLLDKI